MAKGLPKRSENYSEWYNEIVKRADLAENSAVRGCMVIKPYGYAIWEKMQRALDDMFKATGHENAYFPLFVPKSFLEKEEEHAEGFAKECAVVTHYRLKKNPDGKGLIVDPNAKLEEELIIRPTSEADDLEHVQGLDPIVARPAAADQPVVQRRSLGNAYPPVFAHRRISLAGRPYGARDRTKRPSRKRRRCSACMPISSKTGWPCLFSKALRPPMSALREPWIRSASKALMQDGKALQCGTSHFLGQNFAKSFDVKFVNKENQLEFAWATSWGVSTRLMGALDHGAFGRSTDSSCRQSSRRSKSSSSRSTEAKRTWRRSRKRSIPSFERAKGRRHFGQIRRQRQPAFGLEVCRVRAQRRAGATRARYARS